MCQVVGEVYQNHKWKDMKLIIVIVNTSILSNNAGNTFDCPTPVWCGQEIFHRGASRVPLSLASIQCGYCSIQCG